MIYISSSTRESIKFCPYILFNFMWICNISIAMHTSWHKKQPNEYITSKTFWWFNSQTCTLCKKSLSASVTDHLLQHFHVTGWLNKHFTLDKRYHSHLTSFKFFFSWTTRMVLTLTDNCTWQSSCMGMD